jgi:predicted RNA-binding Zn-ribbon protein involved in translation (DUF1610 family)
MITTAELRTIQEAVTEISININRLILLLPRIEAVRHSCYNCGKRTIMTCSEYGEIPEEMIPDENECDQWEFEDLPF